MLFSLAGSAPNSTLLQAHHTFFWQLVFFEWLAHGGDLPIPQEGVSRDHLLDGTEKITRHTTRRHALGKSVLPVMHSYSFFSFALAACASAENVMSALYAFD